MTNKLARKYSRKRLKKIEKNNRVASAAIMLAKRKADGEGGATHSKVKCLPQQGSSARGISFKVKVYVRVRPLKPTEPSDSEVVQVLEEEPRTSLIFDPKVNLDMFYFKGEVQRMRDISKKVKKNQLFEFDEVFPYGTSNEQVFNSTAKTIVSSILDGFNCSVFAYGATGAGKTFTMLGKEDSPGISYLMIKELLAHIESSKDKLKTCISVSYIEVYNEEVRDLLSPSGKKLELREESKGATFISGLKLIPISDTRQLFSLLESGNRIRTQHPTDSNAESSRSHAVFQVRVRMQEKSVGGQVKMAKLTMIDLAGSERGCATGYKGIQFKEGRAINQSLLALGNCINALADGQKYVPYRDSKLTRILKDSLGGNCQTIMIANVSPSGVSYDETYNTLRYATRARSIVTTANQNYVANNLSLGQYRQLVTNFKTKLSKTETEMAELGAWVADCEQVLGNRVKLFSEIMALDSQKKITEWRLHKTLLSQKLAPPDSLSNRMRSSMEQWRNRIEVLKNRMEEYTSRIKQSTTDTLSIVKRMETSCSSVSDEVKVIYKSFYSSWDKQVNHAIDSVSKQHYSTLVKLLAKNEDMLSRFRDETMPFFNHCFDLLKAYGHTTQDMNTQYELIMKNLGGVKQVSWEEFDAASGDDGSIEEINPTLSYFLRLMVPGQTAEPEQKPPFTLPAGLLVPRGMVPAGTSYTTSSVKMLRVNPHKSDRHYVSPLRTLQPTSRPITKSTKLPNPNRLKQHMISSLNKENVREPAKKKYYSDAKSLSKKKSVYKTTSLSNLRSAV